MNRLETVREEGERVKEGVQDKSLGYILTALGLVAGLAWNEAIQSIITAIFPGERNGVLIKLIYAIVVTVIAVTIATYLTRYFRREEK